MGRPPFRRPPQLGLRAQLDDDDVAELAEWNAVGLSGALAGCHMAESSDVEPAEHVEATERFHVEEAASVALHHDADKIKACAQNCEGCFAVCCVSGRIQTVERPCAEIIIAGTMDKTKLSDDFEPLRDTT